MGYANCAIMRAVSRSAIDAPKPAADPAPSADPIPIDRAGLVDTLADCAHSSAWESLRHFAQPASAAELATALGRWLTATSRSRRTS